MRDYTLFLRDILAAMASITRFAEGMSFDELVRDDKTSSAVIRKFEIVGEATKNIPISIRERHPEVPWQRMAGFRDRLIHAYFGIDYKLVWDAIKRDIPRIEPLLGKILLEIERESRKGHT